MEGTTEPKRPAYFLDGIDNSALMSPKAYNFMVERMVEFARHYTEVMKGRHADESVEDAENRLFGHVLTIKK